MNFEFEITGINIPTNDVGGLSDIETALNYDSELGSYSLSTPKTLTIVGTGFKNLFEAFLNDYTDKYSFKIYKLTDDQIRYTLFDGEIYLSEIIFEPKFAKAEVSLVNKGFQNKINNNLSVPVSMSADQSKSSVLGNETFITPPTAIGLGEFYFWTAPSNALEHNGVDVWDLYDCFEHIINYISDGQVSFASTWYDNIADDEHIGVTNGQLFRSGGGNAPILNFRDLFLWCKKLYNLVFVFDTDSEGNKTIRIEHESYLEQYGTGLFIDNTVDLRINIDQSKLYSSVKVGSTNAFSTNGEIIDAGLQFPKVQGGSFSVEEFAVQGDAIVDNQLDLSVEVIYDHNRLEDMAVNSNVEYDDDIVFIQYTASTNMPTSGDPLGVAPLTYSSYFYNQIFLNNQILLRQSIHAPLVLHVSDSADTFMALNALTNETFADVWNFVDATPVAGEFNTSAFSSPIRYINDFDSITFTGIGTLTGNDANNNFGLGTAQGSLVTYTNSKFSAPSDGVYAFEAKTNFTGYYFKYNLGIVRQKMIVTDSLGVLKDTYIAEYGFNLFDHPSSSEAGIRFYDNGNGYSNYELINGDSVYGNVVGLKFTIEQSKIVYLDANDMVYIELECEERSGNTSTGTASQYPLPEYTYNNGITTGFFYSGDTSGIQFKLKPIYFACTKTTGALNIRITPQAPLGLYELSFKTWLSEENIRDVITSSNTATRIYSPEIIGNGIVKNMTIKHKDNLCTFVVGSRKLQQNGS
jgi:hypothetical protein